ncbi:MAG: UDP-4-amino-4,6-dideoxy-N-acetyl-beta-L-altrosamine transaminase [Proteobacteria bacterium]|nr:UDP-4-amino-4,6-dideoxy-N-acetyl-beta-L-altrosamine transaminase [Pseudomonadota bacterium]MBU1738770.1 UDP-4-amino-4,6-dideoxy-N-acetyl-beta-L-altrosamine transaminase [Pseudomonadota bacterium]
MIPYGHQDISETDIQNVVEVLRSDFLTQGPVIPVFEKAVAAYCGSRHAVAVNSATSALHIACLALGVGRGDSVWTTPITFVATANCALYCGADVDFVDINPHTNNMSVECLSKKLEEAEVTGRLPKVVIPVHFCGQSCEMEAIASLGKRYGFNIVEDASHAIGGRYRDEPIGSCCYSDITVFSFHPVKIITTGEGGMLLCNNDDLARRMQLLRSHGITRDPSEMTHFPDGPWYYQQIVLGFNYRMTDIQAALGMSQLQRLDEFVLKRHDIAKCYNELFAELPLMIPACLPDSFSSMHLYVVRLQLAEIVKSQQEVFDALHSAGIGVNLHYIPVYRQPYYKSLGFTAGYCPEAERYYMEAISLPIYSSMNRQQLDFVLFTVKQLFETIIKK